MKPRDQGGVVDARLNVYGVKGLKVAGMYLRPYLCCVLIVGLLDLSICPSNVGNVRRTYITSHVISRLIRFFPSLEHVLDCVVDRGEGSRNYCTGFGI